MRKLFIICLFFCSIQFVNAQAKQDKKTEKTDLSTGLDSFRMLDGKTTIYTKNLELKVPLFKEAKLLADGKSYRFSEVKFYSIKNNYFERFKEGKNNSWGEFYHRLASGKINFYTKKTTTKYTQSESKFVANNSTYSRNPYGVSMQTSNVTYNQTREYQYFQIGSESPQLMKYSKLEKYLKNNQKSMVLLKQAKRNNILGTSLLITGSLISIYGITQSGNKTVMQTDANGDEIEVNSRKISPFVYGGIGVMSIKFLLKKPKIFCKEAIDIYNSSH